MVLIEENIDAIRSSLPDHVTIVAATKSASVEEIRTAIACGISDIGENRVQELLEKYEHIDGANWHFIGKLQTNKVKYIIDKVCLIHSVDSIKLLNEINKQAAKMDKIQDVLIEVSISGEHSKGGIPLQDLPELVDHADRTSNVNLRGLMTMAPKDSSDEYLRQLFGKCDMLTKKLDNVDILSMGMTNDYPIAVSCGSNMVRIGSGIFRKIN